MNLVLTRKYKTLDKNKAMPQTLGELVVGERTFNTLESVYFKNIKKISCVTPGIYEWRKIKPNGKVTFDHIQIITTRPDVTIRAGIDYLTLAGAIVVGDKFLYNETYDLMQVDKSRESFMELMSLLPSKGTIEIKDERLTVTGAHIPCEITSSLSNFYYDIRVLPKGL